MWEYFIMDKKVDNAATPTDAPVTESATVEESTVDNSMDTSEKTEITQEETQDNLESTETETPEGVDPSVPKARLDKVIQERNELRDWKAEQEVDRQEQERLASMTPQDQAQAAQVEKAKDALKKMGFVTQEDSAKDRERQKAENMFISEMNRLESEFDGSDGGPKFVVQEMAEFMDELMAKGQQITDPEMAYKLKFYDAIIDAKAKAQKSTAYAEKQSGGIQEVNDTRKADLEAASKAGDMRGFIKKYAGMPKN